MESDVIDIVELVSIFVDDNFKLVSAFEVEQNQKTRKKTCIIFKLAENCIINPKAILFHLN